MRYRKFINVFLILMLVFVSTVNTALADDDVQEDKTNDDTVKDNDNKNSGDDNDDLMDKIYSEDEVLGYDKNKDYDVKDDLSLQEGFDSASSLPVWPLLILVISLLAVLVTIFVPSVFGWNIVKGGKAATNENPVEAAKGIRDSKKINREYAGEVVEGIFFIALVVFIIGLLM